MSNAGNTHTLATKAKISQKLTQYKIDDLIQHTQSYIEQIKQNPQTLPSIAQLSTIIGCNKTLLLEKSTNSPKLASLLQEIETLQETYLLDRGNSAKNPNFQIFLLKTKHNYKEQPNNLTQNNTFQISPDLLKTVLKEMNS
jgi:deoxyribodipyrimidine photolyase